MNNKLKQIYLQLKVIYKHLRYLENVWCGGGLKRETALSSVGKGWSKFINNLYDAKPKGTNVLQVKEKYAGLRFYISTAPDWYFDLIDYYEQKSYKICEQCGKGGEARLCNGWWLTLCNECYENKHNINKTQ